MNWGRLLHRQRGELVGVAGEMSAVHVDARDSCGLPRYVGGDAWQLALRGPAGEALPVRGVHDVGDGTYRVSFVAARGGRHELSATLTSGERGGFTADFLVADEDD